MKVGTGRTEPRALVRLGLALIAALSVFALAARAQADDTEPVPITTGAGLDWGIKESFRIYIETRAGGEIDVGEGATRNPDGTFHFPVLEGEYVPATKSLSLTFGGAVYMNGHHGALDITIREPRVVITPEDTSLYAKIASKPLDGGETPDEAAVHFASLDVSDTEPTVAGATTTWSAVPAAIASGAVLPFIGHYPIGTEIDPLGFSYDGAGGKPEPAVETWTAPGSRQYEASATWQHPGGDGWDQVRPLAYDAAHDLVHVATSGYGGEGFKTSFQALDPGTLEPIGTPLEVPGELWNGMNGITFDPEIGAVIVYMVSNSFEGEIWQLLWDGDTQTYEATEIGTLGGVAVPPVLSAIRYDPTSNRLYGLLAGEAPEQGMYIADRDGTGWWRAWLQLDPDSGAGGTPFPAEGRSFWGMDVLTDGTVVLSGSRPEAYEWGSRSTEAVAYVLDRHGVPSLLPIPGTAAEVLDEQWESGGAKPPVARTLGYTGVVAGPGNRVHFVEGQSPQRVLTMRKSGWEWNKLGEVRTIISPDLGGAVTSDNVFFPTLQNGNSGPGVLVDRVIGTLPTGPKKAGPDGSVYSGAGLTVKRFDAATVSPTISQHPEDGAVALSAEQDSAEVTFSAAATGTPQPHLQWQTRAPGATSNKAWEDLEGETGATLTISVEREDGARQYRAYFSNHRTVGEVQELVGEIATNAATVTVDYAPTVAVQPTDVSALVGEEAEFKVLPAGGPYPEIVWQRKVDGFWTAVDPAGDFDVNGGQLIVRGAEAAMSGARFRAHLSNSVGVAKTKEVTLTVSEPPVGEVSFGSGHLDWGVKESFREYISGPIAHGSYEASSGATKNPDGTIRFTVYGGSYDGETGVGEIDADGTVSFTGHDSGSGPLLELTVRNPEVELSGDTATLIADVESKPLAGGAPLVSDDVELAELDAEELVPTPVDDPDEGLAFGPATAILTTEGSPAFAGFYTPGVELDPVSATAIFGEPQEPPVDPPNQDKPAKQLPPTPQATPPAPTPPAPPAPKVRKKKPQAKNGKAKKGKRCGKGKRAVKAKGKAKCVKTKGKAKRKVG